MATFKKSSKSTKKTAGKSKASKANARANAERLSKSLSESAQQIWQAGVGAFGRAQEEGSKLFEGLVKEGLNLESSARKFAGGRAEVVRDAVETGVGQARDRATDTWDRLEKVFEDRVQRALTRLGVPGRDDLNDLADRVEDLTGELRRQDSSTGRRTAAGKVTRKTAKRSGASKPAPGRKAAASSKTTAKKAASTNKAMPAKSAKQAATRTSGASAKRTATKKAAKTAKNALSQRRKSIAATASPDAPTASND